MGTASLFQGGLTIGIFSLQEHEWGPLQGFLYSEQHREKKGEKNNFGSKMPIIGDFFSRSPRGRLSTVQHNRAGGCPAQRGGRVLLCYDGLNGMSLHPDLASQLTKGPFVTPGKECC